MVMAEDAFPAFGEVFYIPLSGNLSGNDIESGNAK